MSDPKMIKEIQAAVSIPVMAKVRIGHFVEAQILEALEIDYIDESEVLTVADEDNHINKRDFKVPYVCGCRDLGEALRRIAEGAAFMRTKGEAGTGNVVEEVRRLGRLPVVNFAAGGVATPADAALCMQLGVDGVFVGSGIFKSEDPESRAHAIVQAVTHFRDAKKLAEVSTGIGAPMTGIGMGDGTNFSAREGGNMPAKPTKTSYGGSSYAPEPRSKHADWSPQGTSLVA